MAIVNSDTQTSPGIGALPDQFAPQGGIIIDIVGLNGTRHTAQISPHSMPAYQRGPHMQPNGWMPFVDQRLDPRDVARLGGGILSANLRFTILDGVSASPNPIYVAMFGTSVHPYSPWRYAPNAPGDGFPVVPGDSDFYSQNMMFAGFCDASGAPVSCGYLNQAATVTIDKTSYATVHRFTGFPAQRALWDTAFASVPKPTGYEAFAPATGWFTVPSGQLSALYQAMLAGRLAVGMYVTPPGEDFNWDLSQGLTEEIPDIPLFPPAVLSFTATPGSVTGFGQVVLSWDTMACDSVSIDHGAGAGLPTNGSVTVPVSVATTFTLTGYASNGTPVAQTTVSWIRPAMAIQFSADRTLLASPGTAVLRWSVANADAVTLDGETVSASGSLVTAPFTAEGSRTYVLAATQTVEAATASSSVTVALVATPLAILTATPLPFAGTTKRDIAQAFQASGGFGAYHWSAAGLPAGLTMTDAGLLSGTLAIGPTTSFAFDVTVACTGVTSPATVTFTLPYVQAPLTITTSAVTPAREAEPYNFQLTSVYGLGVTLWSLASGALPPGVVLNSSGLLSGTPSANGYWTFTVRVASDIEADEKTFELMAKLPWSRLDPFHKIFYRVRNADGSLVSGLTNDCYPERGGDVVFGTLVVGFAVAADDLVIRDVRSAGGGLAPEYQGIEEAAQFWDLGHLDGKPYPLGGTCVVALPLSLLDLFSKQVLQSKIEAVLPMGTLPVLRFYDAGGEEHFDKPE